MNVNDFEHYLTVGQLITRLSTVDPNQLVVLAKDGEGNSYSPLSSHQAYSSDGEYGVDLDERLYDPDSTYSGEIYPLPEENADPEEYGTPSKDAVRAVVLWPVN